MTVQQKKKSLAIISASSSLAAGVGAGLAQLPCSDSVPIISIQTTMILGLGAIFGVRLNQSTAEAVLATATATMTGRAISQLLLGWVPILGNSLNALTAAGITETIGLSVMADFANRSERSVRSGK